MKLSSNFIIITAAQALLRLSKLGFRVTHRKKEDSVTAKLQLTSNFIIISATQELLKFSVTLFVQRKSREYNPTKPGQSKSLGLQNKLIAAIQTANFTIQSFKPNLQNFLNRACRKVQALTKTRTFLLLPTDSASLLQTFLGGGAGGAFKAHLKITKPFKVCKKN